MHKDCMQDIQSRTHAVMCSRYIIFQSGSCVQITAITTLKHQGYNSNELGKLCTDDRLSMHVTVL